MLSSPLSITVSLKNILQERAKRSPQNTCCQQGEQVWTWQDLEKASLGVAAYLQQQTLPFGRVAICASASFISIAVQFGAAAAGVLLGHLPANSKPPELARMLLALKPQLIWLDKSQLNAIKAALLHPHLQSQSQSQPQPQAPQSSYQPQLVLLEQVLPQAPPVSLPDIPPETPMQVLFTSGTSGNPKGVIISQRAKLAHALMHVEHLALKQEHLIWCALPLHHQFGQWLLIASLLSGAGLFFRTRFEPHQCWQDLARQEITHLPAVPTMLFQLLKTVPCCVQAPFLKQIVYGAAPAQKEIVQQLQKKLPAVKWFQGFGQTEAGFCLGLNHGEHQTHPTSLGRSGRYCHLQLVDQKNRVVPTGQAGELTMQTPCLMEGYLNDPKATQAFFALGKQRGRSGDILRQDADGFYYYVGRVSDIIISGGVNIHPAELEHAFKLHPAIADAAIVGLPDKHWGEAVTAVLVAKKTKLDKASLKSHCQKHLADWKHPKKVIWLDSLPKTSNGKLQRQLLKQKILVLGSQKPPSAEKP